MPEGGDQEDYGPFLQAMQGLGFAKTALDCSNSHFLTFELKRRGRATDGEQNMEWPQLKACSYKKR